MRQLPAREPRVSHGAGPQPAGAQLVLEGHDVRWGDVEDHLAGLRASLEHMAQLARTLEEQEFAATLQREIAAGSGARTAELYESAMPAWQCYAGLRRYLQRG